jgi:TPR repeat protein
VTHIGNDADVHIDGVKWPANKPLRLAAGPHAVTISAPGYQPYSETVQLAVGETHEVAPQLVVQPRTTANDAGHKPGAAPNAALQCEKLVEAKNWRDAAQMCTAEAGAGSVVAKRNLGMLYNHGNGVKSSDDDAVRWYKQAVDGGDAMAMFLLGTFYEHGGGGIKKDQAAAAQLYSRSADGGYVLAQRTMAEAFEKGHLGLEKNKAKALDLYRKAAAQGDKAASDRVKDLEKQ